MTKPPVDRVGTEILIQLFGCIVLATAVLEMNPLWQLFLFPLILWCLPMGVKGMLEKYWQDKQAYINYLSTVDTTEIRQANQELVQNAVQFLKGSGKTIDLHHWLTLKRYSEKYGVSSQLLVNWIARGFIPATDVITIPELNGIRLIADKTYRDSQNQVA